MIIQSTLRRAILLGMAVLLCARPTGGCTLCGELVGTLSEQIYESTHTVLAQYVPAKPGDPERRKTNFKVRQVLKGPDVGDAVFARAVLGEPPKEPVLLFAYGEGEDLQWTAPFELSPVALKYVQGVSTQRKKEQTDLAFYLPYLVASDRYVHDDAYNIFAKASFQEISTLKDRLDRTWVLKHLESFLEDPDVAPYRTRLMWTLLGVCGKPEDAALFLKLADNPETDSVQAGLDAALACYMNLIGAESLPYVRERYIETRDADRAITGLNAIRFHAVETKRFELSQLSQSLHPLLEDVETASYVIPELARMKDWSVAERLVAIYQQDNATSIRVGIIRYLRSCPLPKAEALVERCREVDPASVRRADTFFPPKP